MQLGEKYVNNFQLIKIQLNNMKKEFVKIIQIH